MEYQFSERVKSLKPSAIREILKNSSDPRVIPLSAGNPAPDAFPYDAVRQISAGPAAEHPHRRVAVRRHRGVRPPAGAPAGLHEGRSTTWARRRGRHPHHQRRPAGDGPADQDPLLNEGDTVLCEAPSFIGSLNTFRSYRAKLVGIPMEEDGIDIREAGRGPEHREKNVKYLYTIPNFQNPSGITMSLEKRKKGLRAVPGPQRDRAGGQPLRRPAVRRGGRALHQVPGHRRGGGVRRVLLQGDLPRDAGGLRHRAQGGAAEDGGVQAGGGRPLQHVGPDRLPPDYDRDRLRGPSGAAAHRSTAGRAACCWRPWRSTSSPWASPGARFEGGLFAWCSLPRGRGHAGVCQSGASENKGLRGAGHGVPHRRVASPARSFRVNFSTPTDEQLAEGIRLLAETL